MDKFLFTLSWPHLKASPLLNLAIGLFNIIFAASQIGLYAYAIRLGLGL